LKRLAGKSRAAGAGEQERAASAAAR